MEAKFCEIADAEKPDMRGSSCGLVLCCCVARQRLALKGVFFTDTGSMKLEAVVSFKASGRSYRNVPDFACSINIVYTSRFVRHPCAGAVLIFSASFQL